MSPPSARACACSGAGSSGSSTMFSCRCRPARRPALAICIALLVVARRRASERRRAAACARAARCGLVWALECSLHDNLRRLLLTAASAAAAGRGFFAGPATGWQKRVRSCSDPHLGRAAGGISALRRQVQVHLSRCSPAVGWDPRSGASAGLFASRQTIKRTAGQLTGARTRARGRESAYTTGLARRPQQAGGQIPVLFFYKPHPGNYRNYAFVTVLRVTCVILHCNRHRLRHCFTARTARGGGAFASANCPRTARRGGADGADACAIA